MMPHRLATLGAIVSAGLVFGAAAAAQVRVSAGGIEDNRGDGPFSGLRMDLEIAGDALAGARAARVVIDKAIDDTGRDLLKRDTDAEFVDLDVSDREGATVRITLANPARAARTLRELSGHIELHAPGRDPDGSVTVADLAAAGGAPIGAPALEAAGIEITIWTRDRLEAAHGKTDRDADTVPGESLASAIEDLFAGLLGGFAAMNGGRVVLDVADPQSAILAIEFHGPDGTRLRTNRMSIGSDGRRRQIHDFENDLAPGTRMTIHLRTPRAIVSSPFRLLNLRLP